MLGIRWEYLASVYVRGGSGRGRYDQLSRDQLRVAMGFTGLQPPQPGGERAEALTTRVIAWDPEVALDQNIRIRLTHELSNGAWVPMTNEPLWGPRAGTMLAVRGFGNKISYWQADFTKDEGAS